MYEFVRPVRYGLLIGFLGLLFGMGWAFYLVLGHGNIHRTLDRIAETGIKSKRNDVSNRDIHKDVEYHEHEEKEGGEGHHSHNHESHGMDEGDLKTKLHFEGGHKNPIMEIAHTRLAMGHLHAMGLALVAIVISFSLAFTTAPNFAKILGSILPAVGSFIYPLAWIIMGYRTPLLGVHGAEESVFLIAVTGIGLVLAGVFASIFFIARDIFPERRD